MRALSEDWAVYILKCADSSFYTGISTDVSRRIDEHNAGKGVRYTRARLPVGLVYQESRPTRSDALQREAAIKAMSRAAKLDLISM